MRGSSRGEAGRGGGHTGLRPPEGSEQVGVARFGSQAGSPLPVECDNRRHESRYAFPVGAHPRVRPTMNYRASPAKPPFALCWHPKRRGEVLSLARSVLLFLSFFAPRKDFIFRIARRKGVILSGARCGRSEVRFRDSDGVHRTPQIGESQPDMEGDGETLRPPKPRPQGDRVSGRGIWLRQCRVVLSVGLSLVSWGTLAAQEQPLARTLSAGDTHRYRVQLAVRSEVGGQQAERIGDQAYLKPLTRFGESRLSWRATHRVLSVAADGTAEIEESLEEFEGVEPEAAAGKTDEGEEARKLSEAVVNALRSWAQPRTLRYRQTPAGQLLGLQPEGVPALDEAPPPLLTLWVLRALRPVVALPARPIRFGERWEEPRAVQLPHWANARGSEIGEWLEAPGSPEPAVRLHVIQQIFGRVASEADQPAEGTAEGRFHGESLASVSLADGRLIATTRSAMREITKVLSPVEGLREAPRFRGRLSVEVQIHEFTDDLHQTDSVGPALRRHP